MICNNQQYKVLTMTQADNYTIAQKTYINIYLIT